MLVLALYLPFMACIFRTAPLPPDELAVAFALGLVSVVWIQLLKKMDRPEAVYRGWFRVRSATS